ncbi:tudor and KH domain-containing protein homolog [Diachasma alloeum]|uniref:tudor and KH domain-containing protein homolog n=1 Tax=Diachasma alloeum TaxID=454923 RepID=UPI00073816B4|nr:tudor and KH domain-containing protein homolog [Diachasma alloeum]XP_015126882.1 tudor and KH domain-containing protein homolog [Diachasma alloeum]
MKWVSRQIALPLVIGISLTGVCVGVLYLLYKQDEENHKSIRSRPRKLLRTVEMKVPKASVPVIIGRGGSTVKDIEGKTSTKIHFSEDVLQEAHRICYIRGTIEETRLAEQLIQSIIDDQPVIEVYEMLAPQKFCLSLLGNRRVEVIQSYSNAKIIMEKAYSRDPDAKRRVIIKGTAEQIATALNEIQENLRDFNDMEEKIKLRQSSPFLRKKIPPRSPATTAEPNESQVASGEAHELHEGTKEVYVSATDSPSEFWVQVVGPGTLALDDLVKAMTDYYNNDESRELHTLIHISEGETVAARLTFDNCWYRAEITSFVGNGQYEVFFLDYGEHAVINVTDILELRTDFLSLRFQAIEFSLANVKPKDEEWSQEACDRFNELVHSAQWKVLIAKVRGFKERTSGQGTSRREGSPIPCVDLFDRNDNLDLNVGKQLVLENLAVPIEDSWSAASSTLSLSKPSHDSSTSPTALRSPLPTTSSKVLSVMTPGNMQPGAIEEIDLTTPKKLNLNVEEVDLVTPVKDTTAKLIKSEGQSQLYSNGERFKAPGFHRNGSSQWNPKKAPIPGGYEDDNSEDDDSLEMF